MGTVLMTYYLDLDDDIGKRRIRQSFQRDRRPIPGLPRHKVTGSQFLSPLACHLPEAEGRHTASSRPAHPPQRNHGYRRLGPGVDCAAGARGPQYD